MGRYPRINRPGLIYHVINRGNNREVIFAEHKDYIHYLNTIQRYKKKYSFKLFSYCLMTNHVHLLIKTSKYGSISRIMQSITVAHTRRFNFKYQRCGHVWQGRFMSPVVSDDEYILKAMQYIEQNPVRAKMVGDIADYPYSSYQLNVRRKKSLLIDREENLVFQALGRQDEERIRQYKVLMEEELDKKDLAKLQKSSRKGVAYISPQFQEQIGRLLPVKRKPGRPKRNLFEEIDCKYMKTNRK